MKDNYRELLSDYIEGILQNSQTASLEVEKLEEPYLKLGKNIQALHSELIHLSNQVKQASGYMELLTELARTRGEWILVADAESGKALYCNRQPEGSDELLPHCGSCDSCPQFRDTVLLWTDAPKTREIEDRKGRIYQISTHAITWQNREAYAHIIIDITDHKKQAQKLSRKAYLDPSLGIYNRLFFKEYMTNILEEQSCVTLCYMDLDGLKYVNDHFGHLEGDAYLGRFVSAVQNRIRSGDILARIGGDEFCLVLPGCCIDDANGKMESIRDVFIRENSREYPASFSFGALEIRENSNLTLKEIIEKADAVMYEYKRKHKAARQA